MKKIDGIIIGTYKGDYWLTKICIASIRYWYPEIAIYIFKDKERGDFNTSLLQKCWNVSIVELERECFGSPLSKIFINFIQPQQRFLLLDSDTVLIGHVIDKLSCLDDDFIVDEHLVDNPHSEWFKKTYYDIDKILNINPQFRYPGYVFNTGQMVITTGIINKQQLIPYVNFHGSLKCTQPEIFSCYDQGIYNYILPLLHESKSLKLGKLPFMIWGEKDNIQNIKLSDIINMNSKPFLIHWAGTVKPLLRKMDGGEILQFYRDYYYSKVPFGFWKKNVFMIMRELRWGFLYLSFRKLRQLLWKKNR